MGVVKYRLDIAGIQEFRWPDDGHLTKANYILHNGKWNMDHCLGTGLLVKKYFQWAVKRVEFVNDRLLYLIMWGWWCDIIIINVHVPSKDKGDKMKDSFVEN